VQPKDKWNRQEWLGWVQATPTGLTVFQEDAALTVWTTSLADGKAAPDLDVRALLRGGALSAPLRTDADGLVRLPLSVDALGVVAGEGRSASFLPASPYGYGDAWVQVERDADMRWYVFDDKNLYKPGETVHVRGWLRSKAPGIDGDLRAAGVSRLGWRAFSSEGNPLGEGTATVSVLGGFTFDLPLPKTPNLGAARIAIEPLDGPAPRAAMRAPRARP
jgi:uncharacterized protein YfaS (alpha-2-macroglobulin family)